MIRFFINKLTKIIGLLSKGSIHLKLLIIALNHHISFFSLVNIWIKSFNYLILAAYISLG